MNIIQTMNGNNSVSMFSDPAAVAAAESAKARIQSAYIVALKKPRNYDNARLKILDACKRPDFAEKAEYTKPVGGTTITGPSIRLAELALREWGNILYENQVVFDDEAVRRIRVTVIDLESNATFSKEIQLSKTIERKNSKGRDVIKERLNSYGEKVYLVKATEDEVQTREAALVSKALRNEGLRLIPSEIIDECLLTARKTMQSRDRKDPDEAKKKLTEAFFAYGVQPTELEKYLGHPLAQCQPDELHELRSIYRAIKDGEARWASFMERKEAERAEKEQPKTSDMMTQLMNASGEDKKTSAQAPSPVLDVKEVERPRKQEPIEAEVEPQQPQNEPLTLTPTQAGTLPFDAAPTATKPAPQASQRSGLTSYEVLREEAQALMGPSGLNLNAEGKGKYLAKITGKSTVKELTMADLRAVINDAQARLESK